MAVSISVPYLVVEDDDLAYPGELSPVIELTANQLLTLRRIAAGMADTGVPLSARRPPDDAVNHVLDLITMAAVE